VFKVKPKRDFLMLKMITAAAAVIGLSATQLAAENYDMVDYYVSAILPSLQFKAGGKPKKTGQTTVYTNYDDGYYKKGVAHSYTRDNTKEVVTDNVTGLVWQDDTAAASTSLAWQGAIDYCTALELGGYTDWRLPTAMELLAIVDNGRFGPTIDMSKFVNTLTGDYWSATTNAANTSYAWIVLFYVGHSHNYTKTDTYYVRCVRAGE